MIEGIIGPISVSCNTLKGYLGANTMRHLALGGPRFEMRSLRYEDLAECQRIAESNGEKLNWLPSFQFRSRLLRCGSCLAYVFEDCRNPDRQIVGYKFSAFVESAYSQLAKSLAARNRVDEAVECLEQDFSFIVEFDNLGEYNSSTGLIELGFAGRDDRHLSTEVADELGLFFQSAFLHVHRGLNISEYLALTCSTAHTQAVKGAGATLHGTASDGGPPFLMGASRADAPNLRGTLLSMLFAYYPPKLYLGEPYQDFLTLALSGISDDAISRHLGLSIAAIKKRWRVLFDLVGERLPSVLPDGGLEGVRGPEKRTALIDYVRSHPEELQPCRRPSQPDRGVASFGSQ